MTINGNFCHIDESGKVVSIELIDQWMPTEVRTVLKVEELPVVYFEETSPMNLVEDCQRAIHVGLTLIRQRYGKVLFACLTTEREIYVLNLVDPRQAKVFEELRKCDIRFYCVKGERIHFRLKEHCCADIEYLINMTALDIFFSMRTKAIELKAIQKHYTLGNLAECSIPFHDKYELIQKWLGVSVKQKSREEEMIETDLIWKEPLSTAARNVIRFRCWFTRALGCRMSEFYRDQVLSCGNRLYDITLLDDDNYDYLRAKIEDGEFAYPELLGALNQCTQLNKQ